MPSNSYRNSLLWRVFTTVTEFVDRRVGWDRLPVPLGLLDLVGLRTDLRRKNLYDTSRLPAVDAPPVGPPKPDHLTRRAVDGSYNDLKDPAMGMAGSRFGRNIPLDRIEPATEARVLSPNPREVSRALLTRTEFVPATSVNSIAAAWLQFMIRDWFSHGTSPTENPWVVPLAEGDPWPEPPMHIMRTPDDPTRPADAKDLPQTRINVLTHWWDGSQVYGVSASEQKTLRSGVGGKLHVLPDGLLPRPQDPAQDPAYVPGFWLGTEMLRTLFSREHNAICDRLGAEYPAWTDEEIFQRARLVNSALLAKIHTVEWTPAVISHPTTQVAMRANWFGLAGERAHRLFGRLSESEVISGIPGSRTDHYGVPFSLTEEFVAVYRMHPLIRDDWSLRTTADDSKIRECDFGDIAGPLALDVLKNISMTDLFYSFGTLNPGLVTLHNFPKFLQEFRRPDGKLQDLAATDILRSRELGVPRYNEFRRLLRLEPAKDFEGLTENPEWAAEISKVYDGDIEQVDLTVGMFAERRPTGFAFSDTAFRIFVLMASRRLNSDRFFTDYYTPAVYTQTGLDWIEQNTMVTVLLRHHPELRNSLASVDNGFAPWATPET
ncbi:peroxidase family protein [Streptomyces fulvoviolaceus]|uniref:peroxidase family protein n=1 Tax=Streptomyces fulvoviolaceus TaxID=285535 RepID=UPI0004C4A852|nr:peroxidase family protein [Streptomyces fulvoviolaceus]MCT9083264.1 heme peroxidase [Streptomyces fulvoviolaceus]